MAVGLIALAALAVVGAVVSGSHLAVGCAAAAAVLCGAAATRIVHLELLDSRVEAARDRAEQAQGYVAITEARIAEHGAETTRLQARLEGQDERLTRDAQVIADLEGALAAAHQRAAEAMKQRAEATRNADAWLARAEGRLEEAEARAAEAILRVHELEIELEATRAELQAQQALHSGWTAKPAQSA